MEYSIKLVKLIVEEVLKAKKIRQKVKYWNINEEKVESKHNKMR